MNLSESSFNISGAALFCSAALAAIHHQRKVTAPSIGAQAKQDNSYRNLSSETSVKRPEQAGPSPVLLPNVAIDKISLHQLTQLGTMFPSANIPNINQCGNEYHQVFIWRIFTCSHFYWSFVL